MVQKEHLLFSLFIFFIATVSCTSNNKTIKEQPVTAASFYVDTSGIPHDTLAATHDALKLNNGLYYFNGRLYSGNIKKLDLENGIFSVGGILDGMLHGRSVSYYADGKIREIRMYRKNKSVGRQIGYWENGNMKFEFYYLEDKREGSSKQWYERGAPYAFLTFKDDKEEGMQQAWRENGKAYINYEAKDGYRYGLQKSNLCYTLEKEKFK